VAIVEDCAYHAAFWIEDGTGSALVDVHDAKLLLTRDRQYETGMFNATTSRLERFLREYGETSEGRFFSRRLSYYEGVLEQGERVAVFGLCRWEPDPDPRSDGRTYRGTPLRLRITSPRGAS